LTEEALSGGGIPGVVQENPTFVADFRNSLKAKFTELTLPDVA
jgi:hypothetical protein